MYRKNSRKVQELITANTWTYNLFSINQEHKKINLSVGLHKARFKGTKSRGFYSLFVIVGPISTIEGLGTSYNVHYKTAVTRVQLYSCNKHTAVEN